MKTKTISILGCGWYGLPMAKRLLQSGFKVKGSTTSQAKLALLEQHGIEPYLLDAAVNNFDEDFFACDILIISIPPKVNSSQISYPKKIGYIALAAQKAHVKQIILISSTGVYQDENFVVNEDILPQPNTDSGKALIEAEVMLQSNVFFTSTILRFGGLIGPERNLAKHFAGKTGIANGLAPINLIHLTDCIGITEAIISQNAFGKIYHGVTPSHPSRKDFYTEACIATGLEKPVFIAELLNWKQIEGKNVPEVLAYEYVFNKWGKYFKTLAN